MEDDKNVLQDILDLLINILKQMTRVEDKVDRSLRIKDCMEGEVLLDNADLCRLLGVTKRTLQRYRQYNLIPYYLVEGKTLYKSSEVRAFIDSFEVGTARKKQSPLFQKEEK